jgi:hypothetical protein
LKPVFTASISPNSLSPDFIFRIANLRYLLNDFAGAIADYNRLLAMGDRLFEIDKRAGLRRPFVVEACGALYGNIVTLPNGLNVAEPV